MLGVTFNYRTTAGALCLTGSAANCSDERFPSRRAAPAHVHAATNKSVVRNVGQEGFKALIIEDEASTHLPSLAYGFANFSSALTFPLKT